MNFSEYRDAHLEFVEAVLSAKLKKYRKLNQIASAQSRDEKRFLIRQFLNDIEIKNIICLKEFGTKFIRSFPTITAPNQHSNRDVARYDYLGKKFYKTAHKVLLLNRAKTY